MSTFETNITKIYGEQGHTWLGDLPELIGYVAKKYALSNLTPLNNSRYNFVLSGLQNDREIVLKLGIDTKALMQEAAALKAFKCYGAAEILAEDAGMILLERINPGSTLKNYFPTSDHQAITITCTVLERLHHTPLPTTKIFPSIQDWLKGLNKNLPIPPIYLEKSRRLRDKLLTSMAKPVLLHGDLHHDNILKSNDAWVIIDPKGVVGETAYEVAAFIRNPMPELLATDEVVQTLQNRIAIFAQTLGLSKQRILEWCFVQAVLAWTWAYEDGLDDCPFKKLTTIFDDLENA